MAEADKPAVAAEPERNLAALLLKKTAMAPPVDVEALLRLYADVEMATLPGRGDAVVVRDPVRRPRVYLSAKATNARRRRFTMAHELGHLLIPWQPGTFVCHTDVSFFFGDVLVQQFESEANRFAAELLLPAAWAKRRLTETGSLAQRVINIAREADVSPVVAVLGLGPLCEAGSVLLLAVDMVTGAVEYSSSAPRTGIHIPKVWSHVVAAQLKDAGGELSSATFGGQVIHAVTFHDPGVYVRPPQPSSEILDEVLRGSGHPRQQQEYYRRRINGIVGAANNVDPGASRERLRAILGRRFVGRADLGFLTGHPGYADFLDAKAAEILERRRRH